MGSPCMECGSNDTRMRRRGDEDRFRKVCDDCGHVAGPFGPSYDEGGQSGLSDFG